MLYRELASIFNKVNSEAKPDVTGYIVFTEGSYTAPYTKGERTYAVSSDNKAFKSGMGGYSIYGYSIEGNDSCRLERYMKEERGGDKGWVVDYCYILGPNKEEIRDYEEAKKFLKIE